MSTVRLDFLSSGKVLAHDSTGEHELVARNEEYIALKGTKPYGGGTEFTVWRRVKRIPIPKPAALYAEEIWEAERVIAWPLRRAGPAPGRTQGEPPRVRSKSRHNDRATSHGRDRKLIP
jgi:hypothetical protein